MAARLDATLADLRAERPAAAGAAEPATGDRTTGVADVVPLRRRRWPAALLAAAAVAAIGFGSTQVLTGQGSDGDSGSGADSAQDGGGVGSAESEPETATRERSLRPAPDTLVTDLQAAGVDRLGPLGLLRAASNGATAPGADEPEAADEGGDRRALQDGALLELAAPAVADCGPRAPTEGARELLATYGGRTALVVLEPREAGSRLARVYACEDPDPRTPVRSVVLPTR